MLCMCKVLVQFTVFDTTEHFMHFYVEYWNYLAIKFSTLILTAET